MTVTALALAAWLVLAGLVGAESSYMPIAHETEAGTVTVRAHLIWCYEDWNPNGGDLSGYRIVAHDMGGAPLAEAETNATGDAIMQVPELDAIRVTLASTPMTEQQAVVVQRGEGALAVAFWSGTKWFQLCAAPATNWSQIQ